ncbi:MAG: hypothetical protein C0598_01090 [Marinilabiliales bacterium]|nr:MAG: hypothetical protein C0598_01090 [Marinilabiliales bacterium]
MNIKNYILILGALLIGIISLNAQNDVSFKASAKEVVSVGERFNVVYELNADGDNFHSPNFGKLHRLSGPNTSQSSSIQYINCKYQQSVSQTYSFLVTASEEGDFTISPASIEVGGKTINSNSLKIKVEKRTSNTNRNTGGGNTSSTSDQIGDDDVYLRTIVSNRNPYQGEQIIVTNRLYTKIGVSNLSMEKSPSYEGFWSKSLQDKNNQLQQHEEIIDGERYVVADISKYALFAQKSGKLTIEPTELKCVAQVQTQSKRRRSRDPFEDFFNDPFFNRNIKNVDVFLKSKKIDINVKPLPQVGKPESFTGAVGTFSFKSEIDHDTITTNDAINLSLKLSGVGNLELINPPKINFPPDFETYEPKINNRISTSSNGVSGSKTIEYLAIARNPGDFNIDALEFSYFNPANGNYYTIKTGGYKLHITKGQGSSSNGISYSRSAQEDIQYIGKDIRHIKSDEYELVEKDNYLFASWKYYVFTIVPLIIMILIILIVKSQRKKMGNTALMKTKKANKIAKTKLAKAEKLMKENNDKEFYNELAQALWGYLSDKFLITQAELSIENVIEILSSKKVHNDITDSFVNALNNIEFARFAPGDSKSKMMSIYEESLNAITLAEKALK